MIFRSIVVKMFICRCKINYGVRNIRQYNANNVVGKCLKCNKRVYGKIICDALKGQGVENES